MSILLGLTLWLLLAVFIGITVGRAIRIADEEEERC
jgi:hypothetical protein